MTQRVQPRVDAGVPTGGQWAVAPRSDTGDLIVDPIGSGYDPGTFASVEVYSDPRRGLTILASEPGWIDISALPAGWRETWPVVQERVSADYDIELPDAALIGTDGSFDATIRCSMVPGDDAQEAIIMFGHDPMVRAWRHMVSGPTGNGLAQYASERIEQWNHQVSGAALTVADVARYSTVEHSGELLAETAEWDDQSFRTVTREWANFAAANRALLARATAARDYPMEKAAADYWAARSGKDLPDASPLRTEAIDEFRLAASKLPPLHTRIDADHRVSL